LGSYEEIHKEIWNANYFDEDIKVNNYIEFEYFTYWVEKIKNWIATLYDEDLNERKKVSIEKIQQDFSFQWY
jgi:hypothetical protein